LFRVHGQEGGNQDIRDAKGEIDGSLGQCKACSTVGENGC
jgi:hypothetical protein